MLSTRTHALTRVSTPPFTCFHAHPHSCSHTSTHTCKHTHPPQTLSPALSHPHAHALTFALTCVSMHTRLLSHLRSHSHSHALTQMQHSPLRVHALLRHSHLLSHTCTLSCCHTDAALTCAAHTPLTLTCSHTPTLSSHRCSTHPCKHVHAPQTRSPALMHTHARMLSHRAPVEGESEDYGSAKIKEGE